MSQRIDYPSFRYGQLQGENWDQVRGGGLIGTELVATLSPREVPGGMPPLNRLNVHESVQDDAGTRHYVWRVDLHPLRSVLLLFGFGLMVGAGAIMCKMTQTKQLAGAHRVIWPIVTALGSIGSLGMVFHMCRPPKHLVHNIRLCPSVVEHVLRTNDFPEIRAQIQTTYPTLVAAEQSALA